MAADHQVFSSDSLFPLLPATVATTPLQYEHSRHPFVMAAFSLSIFSFSFCLSFEGLVFRPRYRNCLLSIFVFLYEYICPQQIRVYLIQSFPVQS